MCGPNGAGKSTLLKLLTAQLKPAAGSVYVHPQVKIGYFSQELENLDEDATLLEHLLVLPSMTQTLARTILGCFLFSGEDVHKRIGDLSMGERCRAAFLNLYFSGANLLVLDEPTNYLDIDTRERIEHALGQFPGAMVVVSHDRYLIRKLATKLLWLHAGESPASFEGTYDEYMESLHERGQSGASLEISNERRRLELELTQLMTSDQQVNSEQQDHLLQRVREIKARLADLQ
ncbi:ATP-binding cassette domain-containing protein [Paenibacillus hexagrammi]|uniref:ATP-binding cassette domain-containing protein n=1 Tax=Paenibacillus hexagrammi TaxID=2908839 RepID=A0ABY3SQN7_9BACL|nr:ATP-binding cassette domain-containing protein [Paenibacillus sp. YPD9-1]UJF35292.1 ATP-binding cassette domain-containing protein [Paenibacillus sp. YPD9-1]